LWGSKLHQHFRRHLVEDSYRRTLTCRMALCQVVGLS